MSGCQHSPTGKRRLSRAMAQGVVLEHPTHSESGVGVSDGVVVVAVRAERRLAWMRPLIGEATESRMDHCTVEIE
jgi:hypothetical protein